MKNFLGTSICLILAKDSKSYDNQNKMAVGKMKLEYREIPINKFAGLNQKE